MQDAVVVGSGPNGLTAAWTLARRGLSVTVVEASDAFGGACRNESWGRGYVADWGSAVHPFLFTSPAFRAMRITERVELAVPEVSYANPTADSAALAWRSIERTAAGLGVDGARWRRTFEPLARQVQALANAVLGSSIDMAASPTTLTRLATRALALQRTRLFSTGDARALMAGLAAHSVVPQPRLGGSAAALVLGAHAHSVGWPIPIGGSGVITDTIVEDLRTFGASLIASHSVASMADLPPARAYVLTSNAAAAATIAGDMLSTRARRALHAFRYGNAISKVDLVFSRPLPWTNVELAQAGTVHLGGSATQVRHGLRDVDAGRHPARPMVILAQPSRFDPSRAPDGKEVVWAYAHAPAGSRVDPTASILARIEEHAPGATETLVDRRSRTAFETAAENATMVGGDFAAGAVSTTQMLARPMISRSPWRIGPRVYLGSASTSPGPGVHGMGGYHAANAAIRDHFS